LNLVVGVLFAVFVAAYVVFQLRVGGTLFDLSMLGQGRDVFRDGTSSWLFRGVELGLVPVCLLFVDRLPRTRAAGLAALVTLGLLVCVLLVKTGTRTTGFMGAYGLVVLVHTLRRRISIMLLVPVLLLGLSASNVLYEFRSAGAGASAADRAGPASLSDPAGDLSKLEAERESLAVIALIVHRIPEYQPYLLGESWLGLAVALVPRWVWPEKADHFVWRDTRLVRELGGGPNPTPLAALLYANFSWIGVVLGMFLWGSFHGGLYAWLTRNTGDRSVVILYLMLLLFFAPVPSGVSVALQFVVPVWIALRFVSQQPRAGTTPA
jgi:hypothetical protein